MGEVCELGIVPEAAEIPRPRIERAVSAGEVISSPEMPDREPITPPPRASAT